LLRRVILCYLAIVVTGMHELTVLQNLLALLLKILTKGFPGNVSLFEPPPPMGTELGLKTAY